MVETRWLVHDKMLVLDNAGIHTGCKSTDLEDCFWETIVNGHPLHVLVIYLVPTRSQEFNPIS
jgi:hypothetical protein